MFYKHYLIVFLCILTDCILLCPWESQQYFDELTQSLTTLAFKACHNSILQSKQTLLYIVDFNSSPSVQPLIQLLHDGSIQTVLINEPSKLAEITKSSQRKNIIFFLNDIGELLSLVLESASENWTGCNRENSTAMKIANASHSAVGAEYGGCNSRQWLPRYYIQVDGVPLEVYPNEACDKEVRISSDELTDVSILSEQTFDLTRGLYINKI